MKIFDSYRGEITDFITLKKDEVSIYVCGPTVYDLPHLGHGRSAVVFDVLRKFFIFQGKKVKFVSNYTDIDDKMINRAREYKITVSALAEKIIPEYKLDYGRLNIMPPDMQPCATSYIKEIIELVEKLEAKGYVYTIDDDGVYFDVKKFEKYGNLSKQNLEDLKIGARVKLTDGKKNPYDFALWKFKKAEEEPSWESKWGEGRPGWHIECSAMSFSCLGEEFDIHGGGLDLKFPHHECEIAQSQGVFGENKFAKYWVHNGFITIDSEKMSKSLGNFFTLREIFQKFDPLAVRLMFLQTHYRSPIDFSDELLVQSSNALNRIHDFVRKIKQLEGKDAETGPDLKFLEKIREDFVSALENDLNLPEALASLFELIKKGNSLITEEKMNLDSAKKIEGLLKEFDSILGVIFYEEEKLSNEEEKLISEREAARKNKEWEKADKLRSKLMEFGIVVEDSAVGTSWKRIKK